MKFYCHTTVNIQKTEAKTRQVHFGGSFSGWKESFFIVFIFYSGLFYYSGRDRVREVVGSAINDDTWIKLGLVLIFLRPTKKVKCSHMAGTATLGRPPFGRLDIWPTSHYYASSANSS